MAASAKRGDRVDYQDLINDHDQIDSLAAKLERAVDAEGPGDVPVGALLGQLEQLVAAHLTKEDSFIYPALVGSTDPVGASGLIVDFEILKQDWQTYLATWQDEMAIRRWPAFQEDTRDMLHRLRERVMQESGLLYSLALREGLITMTPAAA